MSDWYCRNCGYIANERVTFSETCDTCHQPVEAHEAPERTVIEALQDESSKLQKQVSDVLEGCQNQVAEVQTKNAKLQRESGEFDLKLDAMSYDVTNLQAENAKLRNAHASHRGDTSALEAALEKAEEVARALAEDIVRLQEDSTALTMAVNHVCAERDKLQEEVDTWEVSAMSLRALVVSTWTREDLSGDEGDTSWACEMEGSLLLKAINNSIALIKDGKFIEGGE